MHKDELRCPQLKHMTWKQYIHKSKFIHWQLSLLKCWIDKLPIDLTWNWTLKTNVKAGIFKWHNVWRKVEFVLASAMPKCVCTQSKPTHINWWSRYLQTKLYKNHEVGEHDVIRIFYLKTPQPKSKSIWSQGSQLTTHNSHTVNNDAIADNQTYFNWF